MGVVEQKHKSLEELVRKMLNGTNISKYFWDEVVNKGYDVIYHILIRPVLKLTLCELYTGMKPNISHLTFLDTNVLSLITENITLENSMLKLMNVYS